MRIEIDWRYWTRRGRVRGMDLETGDVLVGLPSDGDPPVTLTRVYSTIHTSVTGSYLLADTDESEDDR